MRGAAPHRKRRSALLLATTFATLAFGAGPALAFAAEEMPSDLWPVEVDGRMVGQLSFPMLARAKAQGVNLLLGDRYRLTADQIQHLQTLSAKAGLSFVAPVGNGSMTGAATCSTLKRMEPGERCAVYANSFQIARRLAQRGSVDVVVLRVSRPAEIRYLRGPARARIVALATLSSLARAQTASFATAMETSLRSPSVDLAVTPRRGSVRLLNGYLSLLFSRQLQAGDQPTPVVAKTLARDQQPPTVPQDLVVTQATTQRIAISWKSSADDTQVAGYDVYRDGSLVGYTRNTNATIGGLSCGTSYLLEVDAYDAAKNRSAKAGIRASTQACSPGPTPAESTSTASVTTESASTATLTASALTVTTLTTSADTSASSSLVLADGPAGYWRLGETSGTTAADASGNNRLGTYTASPSLGLSGALAGDSDTAVGFNGASQYVEVPYSAALNGASFTVEAWVYLSGGQGSYRSVVTSRDIDAGGARRGFILYASSANTWEFWLGSGSAGWPKLVGPAVVLNGWTHLVGTYDGATARLYVNGVQAAAGALGYAANTARPLRIAAGKSETAPAYFLPGRLDEVAVYPTALAADRVQAHYAAGTGGVAAGTGGSDPADTTAPVAPAGLTSTGATATSVSLSWTASTDNVGVAGYDVYRDGTKVGSTTATSYTVSALSCATSYTFGVEARDAAGNVSQRTTLAASTSACAALTGTELAWAPPALVNPITIVVPDSGSNAQVSSTGAINLDSSKDYIIDIGHRRAAYGLTIVGGHNIVIIGGHIEIPYLGTATPTYQARRAFYFRDQTGIVHVEGLLIDGADLSEGINIWAPNAIFQFENIRMGPLGARDEISWTDNHPDLIQTWSGPKELRIDRFTGTSRYQGFLTMKADGGVYQSRVYFRRVNVYPGYSAQRGFENLGSVFFPLCNCTNYYLDNVWTVTGMETTNGKSTGRRRTLKASVWDRNPDGGAMYGYAEYLANGTPSSDTRHQGDYIVFTNPANDRIWNGDGSGSGRWSWGVPPGGDFVPASVPGVSYASPGYGS